jgi:hypothetical protein
MCFARRLYFGFGEGRPAHGVGASLLELQQHAVPVRPLPGRGLRVRYGRHLKPQLGARRWRLRAAGTRVARLAAELAVRGTCSVSRSANRRTSHPHCTCSRQVGRCRRGFSRLHRRCRRCSRCRSFFCYFFARWRRPRAPSWRHFIHTTARS